MFRIIFVTFTLWVLLSIPAVAAEKVVILTSLEWPPYVGETLPGQGACAEVVRAAFEAVGYKLEIRFYPWKRAIDKALHSLDIIGYFPEYYSVERARNFLFSDSVGKSPLGLVERKDTPFYWDTLDELTRYKLGVVRGYVNTEQLDQMIAAGSIRVDESVSDLFNLRKLLAGRVDMAIADSNVFSYLINTDYLLHSKKNELRMNPHLLGVKDMYVCFRNGRTGEKYLKIFNEGLRRIAARAILRDYIETLLKKDDQ